MQSKPQSWYEPLRNIASLGSQKAKIRHMGDLAAARKQHLSQFFTPDVVAAFMWSIVSHLNITSILDNSVGSARLLQFAEPGTHKLFGVDVHADTIKEVGRVISEAGFESELLCTGMENVRPVGMDLALINPPFSITLESTGLKAEEGFTRHGRLGPDTNATSDEYAVIQALKAARVIVALLPRSSADAIRAGTGCWASKKVRPRLRAVFDLPADTFREENANVLTSVVVFGESTTPQSLIHRSVASFDEVTPQLTLLDPEPKTFKAPALRYQMLDASEPTIKLPVTGDRTVQIALDGRKIRLRYFCGLTEAIVANAVLEKRIFSTADHRLPTGVVYDGQGIVDPKFETVV